MTSRLLFSVHFCKLVIVKQPKQWHLFCVKTVEICLQVPLILFAIFVVLCIRKMDDHMYCLPNEKEVKERLYQNENQFIDYENKIAHLEKDKETLSQELKQLNEMLTLLKTSMLLKSTELETLQNLSNDVSEVNQ